MIRPLNLLRTDAGGFYRSPRQETSALWFSGNMYLLWLFVGVDMGCLALTASSMELKINSQIWR